MSWLSAAVAANAVIAASYCWIAVIIGRGLLRGNEWRRNHLALTTMGIFTTCSIGHALHLVYLVGTTAESSGTRDMAGLHSSLWSLALADLFTAVIGVAFLFQRLRDPATAPGNQMYEDLRERRQAALDLNDDIIQGLVVTKMAIEMGDTEEAVLCVDRTLASSRHMVGQLLHANHGPRLEPGDLRRRRPSDPRTSPPSRQP
jgi:hypothetical protein